MAIFLSIPSKQDFHTSLYLCAQAIYRTTGTPTLNHHAWIHHITDSISFVHTLRLRDHAHLVSCRWPSEGEASPPNTSAWLAFMAAVAPNELRVMLSAARW